MCMLARWYEVGQPTKKAATKALVRRTQLAVWKSGRRGGVNQAHVPPPLLRGISLRVPVEARGWVAALESATQFSIMVLTSPGGVKMSGVWNILSVLNSFLQHHLTSPTPLPTCAFCGSSLRVLRRALFAVFLLQATCAFVFASLWSCCSLTTTYLSVSFSEDITRDRLPEPTQSSPKACTRRVHLRAHRASRHARLRHACPSSLPTTTCVLPCPHATTLLCSTAWQLNE